MDVGSLLDLWVAGTFVGIAIRWIAGWNVELLTAVLAGGLIVAVWDAGFQAGPLVTALQESAPEYMDIDPCGRQTSVLNERQTMLLSMGEAMDGAPEKKHITRRDQDMHKGAVEGTKPSDSPHHGNPQGPGIDENGWPNDPIATARDRIGANVDQSEGG